MSSSGGERSNGRRQVSRDFKGVWMPRSLWLARGLTAEDRVVLAEIFYLSRGSKGCYATDDHFAQLLEAEERTVQRRLEKLVLLGLVLVQWEALRQRQLFLNSDLGDGALEEVMQLFAEGLADVWPALDREKEEQSERRRRARAGTTLPTTLTEEGLPTALSEGPRLPTTLTGLPTTLTEERAWPSDKSDAGRGRSLDSEKHGTYKKQQQEPADAGRKGGPASSPGVLPRPGAACGAAAACSGYKGAPDLGFPSRLKETLPGARALEAPDALDDAQEILVTALMAVEEPGNSMSRATAEKLVRDNTAENVTRALQRVCDHRVEAPIKWLIGALKASAGGGVIAPPSEALAARSKADDAAEAWYRRTLSESRERMTGGDGPLSEEERALIERTKQFLKGPSPSGAGAVGRGPIGRKPS